jgi:sulfur carrier protein
MQSLRINGNQQQFPETVPATLLELLNRLGINEATVVAEIDGRVIKREDFSRTPLQPEQSIELVRFVGGG